MKVLYFAPSECWPLSTGARLRNYHLTRELAARCQVTYLGLRNPADPPSVELPAETGVAASILLEKDRTYSAGKIVRGMLGPMPVTVWNCFAPRIADGLSRLLAKERFDLVQLETVLLIPYLPLIRAAANRPVVIADWHNIESELMYRYAERVTDLAKRIVAKRTARLLAEAENRFLAECPLHTVASERERMALLARSPGANIQVIPNGVDVKFCAEAGLARAGRESGNGGKGSTILFVGSMDYYPNVDAVVWFVREVWPEIKKACPGMSFVVVGRNPATEVRALAATDIIITGTVDDVRPYYADALAAVIPLQTGSGTRLKILEAMAAGVPVVSTALGAEGIEVTDGINIMLADTPQAMAAAIRELADNQQTRCRIAAAARALVADRYDWSILGERLYNIHQQALREHGRPSPARLGQ